MPVLRSPKAAIDGVAAAPAPKEAMPLTESRASGAVVPMPTLPVEVTRKRSTFSVAKINGVAPFVPMRALLVFKN